LAYRDTAILYAPIRTLVSRSLREGHLPLWNPYEATGKPLFAEGLHGVLHPLSLLAALLDPGGVDLLIALYLVAAALGAFVLARELGLERPRRVDDRQPGLSRRGGEPALAGGGGRRGRTGSTVRRSRRRARDGLHDLLG
jgi:hypothetical protein